MVEWRDTHLNINYAVSNTGLVKSKRAGKILKLKIDRYGYHVVDIGRGFLSKTVHRLVMSAFVSLPPTPEHQVNHKNGIKNDNRLENLEWVTRSENAIHKHWTLGLCIGENHGKAKITKRIAIEIKTLNKEGHSRKVIANLLNLKKSMIDDILRGRTWTHAKMHHFLR